MGLDMKKHTHGWWLNKTNTDFNKIVRLEETDIYGMCICVTCGARKHYKEMNAGHFNHGLDFVRDNQHTQCVRCNQHLSGNGIRYSIWMIDRYGRERVDEILAMKNGKYKIFELQEMRKEYKLKIKKLLGKL